MNLQESVSFSMLQGPLAVTCPKVTKTVRQVCALLAGSVSGEPLDWLTSPEFVLLDVPLHFASTPFPPANRNAILASLRASAGGVSPDVVIDMNIREIGKMGNGFMPSVVVLHGQAAVEGARLAGRETIRAWVGSKAAYRIGLVHADHQLSSSELQQKIQLAHNQRAGIDDRGVGPTGPVDYSDRPQVGDVYPMENYHIMRLSGQDYKQRHAVDLKSRTVTLIGKPQPVKQKYVAMNATAPRGITRGANIEQAAMLHGMGGGMGNGSGPAYDSGLGTQPAAELTRIKTKAVKRRRMRSFAGTTMTDMVVDRQRGAKTSDMQKTLKDGGSKMRVDGSGYFGYPGATDTQQRKIKGAPSSEMAAQLSTMIASFKAARAAGLHVDKIRTVAPPGMEDMVQGLKKRFGEKSPAPFAIAWHHYNQAQKKK